MSVAFTREDSAQTAQDVTLPARPISPHPNLVTEAGRAALEAAAAQARAALDASHHIDDRDERRHAGELALRDLSYVSQRLDSAQVRPAPAGFDAVAFGHRVTIQRDDGRRQTYRIVGEDEADPHNDMISYVSPLARALIGKAVGDVIGLAGREIEILAIA